MTNLPIARARNIARRVRNTLDLTSPVLEAMFMSRGGSKWERAMAYGAAAGSIIEFVLPDMGPHDYLLGKGYRLEPTRLGRFYCNLLRESALPSREEKWSSQGPNIVLWADGKVAAVYSATDEFLLGPYLLNGDDVLPDLFSEIVWGDHDALAVHPNPAPTLFREDKDPDYLLTPMKDVSEYFGEPGLDWYVQRIRKHGNDHRTILLLGPTGVGKSTLGRQIARGLDMDGRVLKIASIFLNFSATIDIIDLVKRFQPTVLMLDDIELTEQWGANETSARDLELFEELHDHVPLTIATKMADAKKEENPFGGLRPGRIDEFFRLGFPSTRVRENILLHYLGYGSREPTIQSLGITEAVWEDIIERTDKMTGAFLAEVARRFIVHGINTYKREVSSVRAQIPVGVGTKSRPRSRSSKAMPNKTERGRIAVDIEEQLQIRDGKWMVRAEPWGVFVQRVLIRGKSPNSYGGYGDPLQVMGYGWHHGKKKGGPYRGRGKRRRMLLVQGVIKELTGVSIKV